jgi:hypothetical protein
MNDARLLLLTSILVLLLDKNLEAHPNEDEDLSELSVSDPGSERYVNARCLSHF